MEALLDAYEVVLCGPVWLEVLGGAGPTNRARLRRGFDVLPYRETPDSAWKAATEHAWRLRDHGQAIPWNDVLIATLSILWGCRVYARDRNFETLREHLGVRPYEPGYGGSFVPDKGG